MLLELEFNTNQERDAFLEKHDNVLKMQHLVDFGDCCVSFNIKDVIHTYIDSEIIMLTLEGSVAIEIIVSGMKTCNCCQDK